MLRAVVRVQIDFDEFAEEMGLKRKALHVALVFSGEVTRERPVAGWIAIAHVD